MHKLRRKVSARCKAWISCKTFGSDPISGIEVKLVTVSALHKALGYSRVGESLLEEIDRSIYINLALCGGEYFSYYRVCKRELRD